VRSRGRGYAGPRKVQILSHVSRRSSHDRRWRKLIEKLNLCGWAVESSEKWLLSSGKRKSCVKCLTVSRESLRQDRRVGACYMRDEVVIFLAVVVVALGGAGGGVIRRSACPVKSCDVF
jgi:hypothetical protein